MEPAANKEPAANANNAARTTARPSEADMTAREKAAWETLKKKDLVAFGDLLSSDYIEVAGPVDFVLHWASPASPIDYDKLPIQTLKVGSLGTHNALGLAKAKRNPPDVVNLTYRLVSAISARSLQLGRRPAIVRGGTIFPTDGSPRRETTRGGAR